ncbi:kinesin-like protein KIF25 isoform X2 [Ambystoma mexicanum]|uniref:kinesin-like protein KIF25 isoform X2 n=1 Tax=Ambystoma mexicanum TaxID=8296 RepID=UPI0037E7EF61
MSPGKLNVTSLSERRIEQLEHKLRAKEERIVVLETENGLLHLKLAQCQGLIETSRDELAHLIRLHKEEKNCQANLIPNLLLLNKMVQCLKQDLKDLCLMAKVHAREFQHQCKCCWTELLAPIQRMQLQNKAMQELKTKMNDLHQSFLEVNERHKRETEKRKILHNSLIELRGNIRVHCRIRPSLPFDGTNGDHSSLHTQSGLSEKVTYAADDETVLVKSSRPGHPLLNKTFQFERVYKPGDGQESVFQDVAPLLTSLLDGYNVCIMAYGQTGSGKTFTMLGPGFDDEKALSSGADPDFGLIPRATEDLFRLIQEKPPGSHSVEVSLMEVYNNDIFDLLAKDASETIGIKRDVITTRDGKSDVPSLTYETVQNAGDVLHLVKKGVQLRARHPTLVHAHSSRSHLIVTVTITTHVERRRILWDIEQNVQTQNKKFADKVAMHSTSGAPCLSASAEMKKQVKTKLQLVDLAGSECVGGDAKLLVMLCVSPCQKYLSESLQSLGFGSRARQVQRGPAKKRNVSAVNRPK